MDNGRGTLHGKCCCKCISQPVPNFKEDAFKQGQAPRPNGPFSKNQLQIQMGITHSSLGVPTNPTQQVAYYEGTVVLSDTENGPESFLSNLSTLLTDVKSCLATPGILTDFKLQYNHLNDFLTDFEPQYNLFETFNFTNLNTEL